MPALHTYIVEDSAVIRENLIATLEELACVQVVGWAADEARAVSWLCEPGNVASLLIVDIFLARGSGLGVLRAVSRLSRRPRTVVLSNYASPDMRRTCLQLGAEQVFDKSTDIDALIDWCNHQAANPADCQAEGPTGSARS